MIKIKCSWIICLFISSITSAQVFDYQAKVGEVKADGFCKIELSPELLGKLSRSQTDVRLYNENGIEIPYIYDQEQAVEHTSLFHEYEITEKNYKKDDVSYLIFENPEKKEINNISVIVKNTEVRKRARLSGSDDGENWFVIKNDYLLHSMYSNEGTSELKILNFPLSNYAFFRLEINDYWKLPINILNVGFYDYKSISGKKVEFDYTILSQKDSAKTTYIKLSVPEKVYIENLKFEISGADYYLRNASVFVKHTYKSKRKKNKTIMKTIYSFNLNSNSTNNINIGSRKVKELYIEIDNKDNQPLIINKITGSYLKKYLVADLKMGNNYVMKFGNEKSESPQYDLVNFKNEIPVDIDVIKHESITAKEEKKEVAVEPSIFDNVYFIWSIIGVVGLVLGYISLKILKEMGEKKSM